MASVTLENVKKVYPGGVEAVKGITLAIPDGSFTVLLGPSGCGKSTLLRMIAGLETVTDGVIRIGSRIVNNIEPAERDIAMVFQNYALYPHMTVWDNMAYGLKNRGTPKPEIARRVTEAARLLELEPLLKRRPRELSGGQRQRVAMGRAIVREPQVFLFDEPLSNLDAKLRVQTRIEIRRLHNRLKATSIFVTHDQVEAMTLADLVVVMNQGRIEQVGAPLDVYRRPATRFVATFIGSPAMNMLRGRVVEPGRVALEAGSLAFDPAEFAIPSGTELEVGVRPEDLTIAGSDEAASLSFSCEFIEELGATRVVHGNAGSEPLSFILPSSATLPAETTLRLTCSPGAVHLFDRATAASLRRNGAEST